MTHRLAAFCFGALVTATLASGSASAKQTYNDVEDFSRKQNSAAPWSWLSNGAPLGTYDDQVFNTFGLIGWTNGQTGTSEAVIAKDIYSQFGTRFPVRYNQSDGTTTVTSLYLDMDPQTQPNVTVRFTVPVTGFYRLEGRFKALNTNEVTHTVQILRNGTVLRSYQVTQTDQFGGTKIPIRVRITLVAGDTIDFVCDTAGNGGAIGTGLAVNITGPKVRQ